MILINFFFCFNLEININMNSDDSKKLVQKLISELDQTIRERILNEITLPISLLINPVNQRRKSCGKIPRPQNPFILFRRDFTARLKLQNPKCRLSLSEISKEASKSWHNASHNKRNAYE